MTRKEYEIIEKHMLSLMQDSAHDKYHVYRVLYAAVDMAAYERGIDIDVLLAACLLHDIGREKQFADASLCHAQIGGEMAFVFLLTIGWGHEKAMHVKECIASHRYRSGHPPQSIEAKILFDADKLDASGGMGIARTLIYQGQVGQPLYAMDEAGNIITEGGSEDASSFFQEYHYKLKKVYDSFYTERGRQIALAREKTAMDFYEGLHEEITQNARMGRCALAGLFGERE